jgi:hypothetical protein
MAAVQRCSSCVQKQIHYDRSDPVQRASNGFGNYLQDLSSAAKWSLRDLSAATGLSPSLLWAYEHGPPPRLESLAALSRAFRQSLHRFIPPLE